MILEQVSQLYLQLYHGKLDMLKLPVIPGDKYAHFSWGVIIATITTGAAMYLGINCISAAIVSTTVIGIAKEIYDGDTKGSSDVYDAVATSAGAIPIVIMTLLNRL